MFKENHILIKKGNFNSWSKSRTFSKYKSASTPSLKESIVIDSNDAIHISCVQDFTNSSHTLNPSSFSTVLVNFKLNNDEIFEQDNNEPPEEISDYYSCPSPFGSPQQFYYNYPDDVISVKDAAELISNSTGNAPTSCFAIHPITGDIYVAYHTECSLSNTAPSVSGRINVYDYQTKELKLSKFIGGQLSHIMFDPNGKLWVYQMTFADGYVSGGFPADSYDVSYNYAPKIMIFDTDTFTVQYYLNTAIDNYNNGLFDDDSTNYSTHVVDIFRKEMTSYHGNFCLDETQGYMWFKVRFSDGGGAFSPIDRILGYDYNNLDSLPEITEPIERWWPLDLNTGVSGTLNASCSGGTATITHTAHGLTSGSYYVKTSANTSLIPLGFKTITVTGPNTFTFPCNAGSGTFVIRLYIEDDPIPSWMATPTKLPNIVLDGLNFANSGNGIYIFKTAGNKMYMFNGNNQADDSLIIDLDTYPWGYGGENIHPLGTMYRTLTHPSVTQDNGSPRKFNTTGFPHFDKINNLIYAARTDGSTKKLVKYEADTLEVIDEVTLSLVWGERWLMGQSVIDSCGQLWSFEIVFRVNEDPIDYVLINDTIYNSSFTLNSIEYVDGYQKHPITGDIYFYARSNEMDNTIRIIRNTPVTPDTIKPKKELNCQVIVVNSSLSEVIGERYQSINNAITYINTQPDTILWVILFYSNSGTTRPNLNGNRKVIIKGMNIHYSDNIAYSIYADDTNNSENILVFENLKMNSNAAMLKISDNGQYILMNKCKRDSSTYKYIEYTHQGGSPDLESLIEFYNCNILTATVTDEIENINSPVIQFKINFNKSFLDTNDNTYPVGNSLTATGTGPASPIETGNNNYYPNAICPFTKDDFFYIELGSPEYGSGTKVYIFNHAPTTLKNKLLSFNV